MDQVRWTRARPSRRKLARSREAGFSMFEMLTIVVIIGILAALAIPRLDWTAYRVNAEARNMVMQLAYAERLAVSLQHNVLVTVDVTNRHLVVDEDKNDDGVYQSSERRRVIQLDDGVVFVRNAVPDLPAPAPTNALTTIIYRRDGSASTAGVIFMNSQRGVSNGNNKHARALQVIRATGRAVWYSYSSGTWRRMN